jgi:GNAT superfamily N-acetyltransferase
MTNDAYRIVDHIPEANRTEAAALFWQAFKGKLGRVMHPEAKALSFLNRVLDPTHGIGAVASDGSLLGMAGFKTDKGALIGGGLSDLAKAYSWPGAIWRGLLLDMLERDTDPNVLTMDGIVVTSQARGKGVGTALLHAICARARDLGKAQVRLDVIDSNPRAEALYRREGFEAAGQKNLGMFAPLFGFRSAQTMFRDVTHNNQNPPGKTGLTNKENYDDK